MASFLGILALALGKIPQWAYLGLGALLLLTLAHLSGRWIEAESCHERALQETANQVDQALAEQEARHAAADKDRQEREKREKRDHDKEQRIIGEIHNAILPDCDVPANVMRLLDDAGR